MIIIFLSLFNGFLLYPKCDTFIFTLNNVIHHLDDLKIANHKVEEVERQITEQDWKLRHSNMDYNLSFLSYVGMVTNHLNLFYSVMSMFRSDDPSSSQQSVRVTDDN
jgi:hypothetical protein